MQWLLYHLPFVKSMEHLVCHNILDSVRLRDIFVYEISGISPKNVLHVWSSTMLLL